MLFSSLDNLHVKSTKTAHDFSPQELLPTLQNSFSPKEFERLLKIVLQVDEGNDPKRSSLV